MKDVIGKAAAAALATAICLSGADTFAYEYNVTQSAIRPRWSGAKAGEWTFDREAAFANAKRDGKYTIVMFTGSWWCPYCQTCESKVLTSSAWADYVAKNGYYLAECDYPYRFPVPEGQEWKGTSPLGNGWGFQCWLYDAGYLAENGLTADEGLAAIQEMYDYQDAMALPGSTVDVIGRLGGGTMELHKISYLTMLLFRPDGTLVGRVGFPWYNPNVVSDEEAINYMIQNLEIAKNWGGYSFCADPTEGGLQGTAAAQYLGWLSDGETGEIAGTVTVKAGKANKKTGVSKLTATFVPQNGAKVKLAGIADTPSTNKVFQLTKSGSPASASIKLGANGLVGYYNAPNGKSYAIQGARNVFAAKDNDAKARAAALSTGFWTLALTNAVEDIAFARGSGALSVSVKAKGKAKVTGWLGDGTKVNVSATGIMGDDGLLAVPVSASLYSKHGGVSFLLKFKDGHLTGVEGLSKWTAAGKNAFSVSCGTRFVQAPGAGTTPEALGFKLASLNLPDYGIANEELFAEFRTASAKWKGDGASEVTLSPFSFSLSYAAKTGLVKGTLTIMTPAGKKVKATVNAVIVNGYGYGTAVFKGIGTWRIRFASTCGGDEGC